MIKRGEATRFMYKQKRLLISSLIIPSKRKATETTKDTNKKAIVVKTRMSHPRACERRDLRNTGSKMKRTTLGLFTEKKKK